MADKKVILVWKDEEELTLYWFDADSDEGKLALACNAEFLGDTDEEAEANLLELQNAFNRGTMLPFGTTIEGEFVIVESGIVPS